MCGIVGVTLENPTEEQLEIIKKVFLETEIRGKHASGIAWYNGNSLEIIKENLPISELLNKINFKSLIYNSESNNKNNFKKISLIGHIRYSTSDILYNQPLGEKDFGYIVHNGVITQEFPEHWEDIFGYACETKNDSELIYQSIKNFKNPIEEFPNASISALEINTNGEISSYRNSLRPQWVAEFENGKIYASTQNILIRSGISTEIISKVLCHDEEKQLRTMKEYA